MTISNLYESFVLRYCFIMLKLNTPQHPKVPGVVRRTAIEMAEAFWDESGPSTNPEHDASGRSAEFRKTWPDRRDYVALCWPSYVKTARDVLAQMLHRNDVGQELKDTIYDALTKDVEWRTADLPPEIMLAGLRAGA